MSTVPTSPPSGWYPAPDGSPTMWWWDGAQWTTPAPQVTTLEADKVALAKLAFSAQVLLVVCGVLSLVTIGLETFGFAAVSLALDGSISAFDLLTGYDQVSVVVTVASLGAL